MGLGWSLPWATPREQSPSSLPTGRPSLAPTAYTRASIPSPHPLLQAHLPSLFVTKEECMLPTGSLLLPPSLARTIFPQTLQGWLLLQVSAQTPCVQRGLSRALPSKVGPNTLYHLTLYWWLHGT